VKLEQVTMAPELGHPLQTLTQNSRCGRASWRGRRRAARRGPGRVEGSGRASKSAPDQVEEAVERQPAGRSWWQDERSWRPVAARPAGQSLRSGVRMMLGTVGRRCASASGSSGGSGRVGRTGEIMPAAAAHRASPRSRERARLREDYFISCYHPC
jgi:hypothetical protein